MTDWDLKKRRLRNLAQYKELTDDEFNDLFVKMMTDVAPVEEYEKRIQIQLKRFENDYDLSDMKENDHRQLRALAQAIITLDDLETHSYKVRLEGITEVNLNLLEKLSLQMSRLRTDISKLQDDLKISRKVRKGDKEASIINEIETLKIKARKFYESRMQYIYCPSCSMLLGTVWTLYPHAKNKVTLVCERKLDNGEMCGTKVVVTTDEMVDLGGSNRPEIMPEEML